MSRLLTDPLPLRSTADLPEYREPTTLPWVYGRVTVQGIPLDANGVEWLISDHPIVSVERVEVGGMLTTGWALSQRQDATGRAIAVLRLSQPSTTAPAVTLSGRRHPTSGSLLEHPAEIAADLLRQCGWPVDGGAFEGLWDDLPGLAVGYVIDQPATIREALAGLLEPLGSVWSVHPSPTARLAGTGEPVTVLTPFHLDGISASTDTSMLATVARVSYGWDWSAGNARYGMILLAPEAVERFGEIVADIALPMVRTARDALFIGSSRLAGLARSRWALELTTDASASIALGDTVALDHPYAPVPLAEIRSRRLSRERGKLTLGAVALSGAIPRVELVRSSMAVDPATPEQLTVTYQDGVATFTILSELGDPMEGATVTLDGSDSRTTDRAGRVQFPTSRGSHTLLVTAAGYLPMELEVSV